jgi:NAD(P)-dependent dehydrogenase (short-subunit alcohol dehydrogenase family)
MARFNDGEVAIVTGAAQGIGAAYAKTLAAEGAKVAVCDVLDVNNTVNIIKQAGGEAIGMKTDVTDDKQLTELVSKTAGQWGRVDILVNNAAIFAQLKMQKFMDIPEEEWDRVLRVNVRGVFQCVKAVVPEMKKRKYGKIINIASGTVFKGTPLMLHYVTSKGAIVAMTRALARELGDDGIRVNTLAPGLTASEGMVRAGQFKGAMGEGNIASRCIKREEVPEDLQGAMLFLATKDSDFVSGQALVVDGGSFLH